MSQSIRLRFINWLQGVVNQIAQLGVKHLRKLDVEPQPTANMSFWRGGPIDNALGQRQVDDVPDNTPFSENGGHHWRNHLVNDDPRYAAYFQGLAAPNHYFISHQTSPLGKNYLSLTANSAGVEGA